MLQYPYFYDTYHTFMTLSLYCFDNVFTRRVQQKIKAPVKVNPFSVFLLDDWSDQDQDSLLVKRRNDNHSPGPVI